MHTNSTGKRFQFIQSAVDNRCLGYDYRQNESRVYEDVCREDYSMRWAAIRVSDNIYKFENAETLDCMFAQHAKNTSSALVGFDCDGTLEGATSEFLVSSPLPGVFSLTPNLNSTDHTLCVESGRAESAPKMVGWPRVQDCNNGLSQKFIINYDEDDKPTPPPPRSDPTLPPSTLPTPTPPPPTTTTITITKYASYPSAPPDIIVTTTSTSTIVTSTVLTSTSYVDCTAYESTTLSEPAPRSSTNPQAFFGNISDTPDNQSSDILRRQGTKLPY